MHDRDHVDTDYGQYEGEYNNEEIASHCSACGKMWCGPCQRALRCLRLHKLKELEQVPPQAQDQAQDQAQLRNLFSYPMCRALVGSDVAPALRSIMESSHEEEEFARRWSLVHDRTPGSTCSTDMSLCINMGNVCSPGLVRA